MTPLNVAVWGIGPHARKRILPALAETEGLRLLGVCSRDAGVVAQCAAEMACEGWTDPAAMLRDARVDVVYVATPTGLHAAHAAAVLEAGHHAWVEKPLAAKALDAAALVDLSRERGRSLCEGMMYLHHPQFSQLAGYLRSGRIGRPVSISCRFGIPALEAPGFRNDPALGGGALLDVGCYPVSAVLALFPAESFVVTSARVHTPADSAVDTEGHAIITASNGIVAHLEWRTHCAYRNEIFIWGETGGISTELIFSKPASYTPAFDLTDVHGRHAAEYSPAANHFVGMLHAFRDMTGDRNAAECERMQIQRRASMLEQIGSGRTVS